MKQVGDTFSWIGWALLAAAVLWWAITFRELGLDHAFSCLYSNDLVCSAGTTLFGWVEDVPTYTPAVFWLGVVLGVVGFALSRRTAGAPTTTSLLLATLALGAGCARARPEPDHAGDSSSAMQEGGRFKLGDMEKSVFDSATGLEWQRIDYPIEQAWKDAARYCEVNQPGLPGTGWRLPTVAELKSIHDTPNDRPDVVTPLLVITQASAQPAWWSSDKGYMANKRVSLVFRDGYVSQYDGCAEATNDYETLDSFRTRCARTAE